MDVHDGDGADEDEVSRRTQTCALPAPANDSILRRRGPRRGEEGASCEGGGGHVAESGKGNGKFKGRRQRKGKEEQGGNPSPNPNPNPNPNPEPPALNCAARKESKKEQEREDVQGGRSPYPVDEG